MDRVVVAPEIAGLLRDFRMVERRGFAKEKTPLAQVHRVARRVFHAQLEVDQVGRARLIAFVERIDFFRDDAGWQCGAVDHFFAFDRLRIDLGKHHVFERFASTRQRADGTDVEAVDLDLAGLAADFEFVL